jgi:hypothetical protein
VGGAQLVVGQLVAHQRRCGGGELGCGQWSYRFYDSRLPAASSTRRVRELVIQFAAGEVFPLPAS